MLHVLLILLKILGFLLLFLLLLIFILLIAAFRYRFELKKPEGSPLYAKARVSWFAVAVIFTADYIDQTFVYQLKLFGIQILGNQPEFLAKKEEKQRRKTEKETGKEEQEPMTVQSLHEDEKTAEQDKLKQQETETSKNPKKVTSEADRESQPPETSKEPPERSEETPDASKEKTGILTSLKNKAENLKNKAADLRNKSEDLKKTYDDYHGEALIRKAFKLLKKILKHVLPRKLTGYIRFGLDDPADTGYLTGLAAAFYPVYGKHFSLEPDFREKCFEADCRGSGRIRIMFFLYLVIWLLLDKNVRKLIGYLLRK